MVSSALSPSRERWLLWALAAVQFSHIVDFMVMMPLGPQFIAMFRISDARFGLLVSSYSIAAGLVGLIASIYIDRFDRRRLLLMVYAGFTLATVACALSPDFNTFLLARIMAGAFGGILGSLVQTIVGDVVPFERRGQAMGIVMSAFAVATVMGVPAALWVGTHWGWHWPFLSVAILSTLCWAVVWHVVPPLRDHLKGQASGPVSGQAWQRMREVLTHPAHVRAYILTAAMLMGSFAIIPYITIFTTTNVGLATEDVPFVYFAGGVATFFTSRLWGRLADRYGKENIFRLLALLSALPMLILTHLGVTPIWLLLIVTTAFFVLVSGRMVPAMALLTQTSEPSLRGGFMSVNSACQSTAMGLAAWIGGLLIERAPDGLIVGYGRSGWLAVASSLFLAWWVGRLGSPSRKS